MDENQKRAIDDAIKQFTDNAGVMKNNQMLIDFSAQRKKIEEAAAGKNPLVKEYLKMYMEAEKRPYTFIGRMTREMKNIAAKQEILKTAASLCENENDKNELLKQSTELDNNPAMLAYKKYIKGLEYLAGINNEPEEEVIKFFKDELRSPLTGKNHFYEDYRTGKKGIADTEEEKLYQELVAPVKARDIFSKQGVLHSAAREQFLGDYSLDLETDQKKQAEEPFSNRLVPVSYCVGKMLKEGYRLEDIMDPRALVEEKARIGKEYIELREKKDSKTYGKEMYEGCEAAIKAFKKYVKDHRDELKNEQDLAMHANTFGFLALICYDYSQEIPKCEAYIDKNFKTKEEISAIGDEAVKYICGAGIADQRAITYELEQINKNKVTEEIQRQMYIKQFLEELQKDEPDYDAFLLSAEDFGDIVHQLERADIMDGLFDEDLVNTEEVGTEGVKKLASMMSTDFLDTKKIVYTRSRIPVKVTKVPEKDSDIGIEVGKEINAVVTCNDKQIVETNIPLKIDAFLKNMEKRGLRGKEEGNSNEFNKLLEEYDNAISKMGKDGMSNKECIDAMEPLMSAASNYIKAKRAQKGYDNMTLPDEDTDLKMMGKRSGASIFTSRGKDRYEFAMKIVINMGKMADALRQSENQNKIEDSKEYEENESEREVK